MPLSSFHPLITKWFSRRFTGPTEAQRRGWPPILEARDTLIAAPTGSGKTLAAFLAALDCLIREGISGNLQEVPRVIYISPLKALSNDIQRNLQSPLDEIRELARREEVSLPEIRVLVRTGDTPAPDRKRMVRHPPHILATTPESFYLLLTAESSRRMLPAVDTVIVDEIHAMARDKRGSHLSLSLERLEALCVRRPVRIGLSATQKPLEEMARLLVGTRRLDGNGVPDCRMIDVGHLRELDLAVESPKTPLSAVCSNEQWKEVYEHVAGLIQRHRSTLVFVNTRRLAERVTHHLSEILGKERVASHHGSLSKKIRLQSEARLKAGELQAVVATASLELGIDIGFIDLVIQLGSPRSIATFLQRIGRSGHALGVIPKGRLFALTRDELLECAALIRAVRAGRLDRIMIPEAPLDILAQQIVAASACEEWEEEELFALIRGAYPYRDLSRPEFDAVLRMLNEGISCRAGRVGAYLYRDQIHHRVKARRGARLAALTSGGAIPETADYRVVAEPDQVTVGSVDEDFAVESLAGDVFLLGNASWRIRQVRSGEVLVADAHGAAPTIPFWRGEAPGRTFELSEEVSALREEIDKRLPDPPSAAWWLAGACALPEVKSQEAVEYLLAQKAAVGMIPTQSHLLVERFFDESGGMELVIHAPFGGRINRALGLALRKRFCRRFDFELQASADDNGIVISLGPQQSFSLETVPRMIHSGEAGDLLTQAVLAAPVFRIRWRWNATRALAVLRYRGGKKVPPPLQRFRADDLLTAVFPEVTACPENLINPGNLPLPDHPLIRQTLQDALHEAMDLEGLIRLLREIEAGTIRVTAVDSREPSPFSYQILNAQPYAFLDDAPLEERRARAVATRRTVTVESIRDIGKLDPTAIDQVRGEAWPLVRDPDELHDALMLLGLLPAGEGGPWKLFLETLILAGRAVCATGPDGASFWAATERWPLVRAARPDLVPHPEPVLPEGVRRDWDVSEAETALILGRMEVIGPATSEALSGDLGLLKTRVEPALVALETQGLLLRGRFTPEAGQPEWCARNLLTRIHRMTLERLRRQIQPVPVEEYTRFLLRWHHLEPDVRLHGPEGVAAVIEQLQGFEIPARAWEQGIFPLRIAKYEPGWLDELCLNGEVAWGKISHPEPHRPDPVPVNGRNTVRPANRVLPISLMLREDLSWLRWRKTEPAGLPLSHPAMLTLDVLRSHGATFFPDLLARTRLLPAQLEEALWELVPAGQATGDGFAALRSLINPLRKHQEAVLRSLKRRGRAVHATRRGAGRWTLLPSFGPQDSLTREEVAEAWTRQLLLRYGILFRDLLAREEHAPRWYELRPVLRRLEARGEIFGGRFVAGVSGEQYGLSEAVEELRRLKRAPLEPRLLFISAVDPLNLAGILTPGPRVTAAASNRLAFLGGSIVGSRQGKDVRVAEGLDQETAGKVEHVLKSGKIPI